MAARTLASVRRLAAASRLHSQEANTGRAAAAARRTAAAPAAALAGAAPAAAARRARRRLRRRLRLQRRRPRVGPATAGSACSPWQQQRLRRQRLQHVGASSQHQRQQAAAPGSLRRHPWQGRRRWLRPCAGRQLRPGAAPGRRALPAAARGAGAPTRPAVAVAPLLVPFPYGFGSNSGCVGTAAARGAAAPCQWG
jgi:hypothetical protein